MDGNENQYTHKTTCEASSTRRTLPGVRFGGMPDIKNLAR